jgi:hypothetical protein
VLHPSTSDVSRRESPIAKGRLSIPDEPPPYAGVMPQSGGAPDFLLAVQARHEEGAGIRAGCADGREEEPNQRRGAGELGVSNQDQDQRVDFPT